ncbi:MAG: ACT domain-containing protein, partial [Caldilineaceae bacterium]|nr:ACT domain-containing protein [Caldilineaceae bacterium]
VVPEADASGVMTELQQEFGRELERRYIDEVVSDDQIVIVAIVGSGMKGVPGLAAGIFNALAQHGINVIAIAQGSSEANISVVLAEGDATTAVRSIHDAFELYKPTEERTQLN